MMMLNLLASIKDSSKAVSKTVKIDARKNLSEISQHYGRRRLGGGAIDILQGGRFEAQWNHLNKLYDGVFPRDALSYIRKVNPALEDDGDLTMQVKNIFSYLSAPESELGESYSIAEQKLAKDLCGMTKNGGLTSSESRTMIMDLPAFKNDPEIYDLALILFEEDYTMWTEGFDNPSLTELLNHLGNISQKLSSNEDVDSVETLRAFKELFTDKLKVFEHKNYSEHIELAREIERYVNDDVEMGSETKKMLLELLDPKDKASFHENNDLAKTLLGEDDEQYLSWYRSTPQGELEADLKFVKHTDVGPAEGQLEAELNFAKNADVGPADGTSDVTSMGNDVLENMGSYAESSSGGMTPAMVIFIIVGSGVGLVLVGFMFICINKQAKNCAPGNEL